MGGEGGRYIGRIGRKGEGDISREYRTEGEIERERERGGYVGRIGGGIGR